MIITFDIETIPTKDGAVIREISKSIKPPRSIKKDDSIKKWMDENFDAELDKALRKTSLNALYGSVACIAWKIEDQDVITASPAANEYNVIDTFFMFMDDALTLDDSLCGHNIRNFDLKFLRQRAAILGIKIPVTLKKVMDEKPWVKDLVLDTMHMWSQDRSEMVSLDDLCRAFRIDGKVDFDGSMVAETWERDPQKVVDYCMDDVDRARLVYKRLAGEYDDS